MNREDIAAIFDRAAAGWDAAHGPESARAAEFHARAAYLRALCNRLGRPLVLDLGCGTGCQLLDLADCIDGGTGVDLSPAMVARAQENAAGQGADIHFQAGDAAAPGVAGRFDLILYVGSLEHLADPAAALAAARRRLAASGRIAVIMPHPWHPLVRLARRTAGKGAPAVHLSPRRLARLAGAAGLAVESVTGLPYSPFGGGRARWLFANGAYAALFA